MSCNPNEKVLKPPLRAQMLYDYELGTKLRICVHDGTVYEGYAYRDPQGTGKDPRLKLVQGWRVVYGGKKSLLGFQRFTPEEIEEVLVLGDATEYKRHMEELSKVKVAERVFHTLLISSEVDLKKMVIKMKETTTVALNLYGIFVGRDGTVGWVSLFFGDTLVCIDVLKLGEEMPAFWTFLSYHIFENEHILKVIYNSRPVADYLYHKHCIRIRNVFDIQVAQFYNWTRGQERGSLVANRQQVQYMRLSMCLKQYLSDQVIPEELQLLEEFEKRDFSARSPLMERPVAEKKACKCVAIEMKYLLRLKTALESHLQKKYLNSVSHNMNDMVTGNSGYSEMYLRAPLLVPDQVYNYIVQPNLAHADQKPGNGQATNQTPTKKAA